MTPDPALVELFLAAVAVDATSGKERPVAQFIRTQLEGTGITIVEDDAGQATGGNCGNLICRYGDGGNLAFLAHMDTARPTADLKPQLLTDRITSGGDTILGADNRAGVALLVHNLRRAARGELSATDFTAAFTVSEETSLAGSRHLRLDQQIQMAFAFDSSLRPGHFINGSYGAIRFTIRVIGRTAHAGIAPEKGINAIHIAALATHSLPMGRVDAETTLNFGSISGGGAVNVVPAEVVIDGEVRSKVPERGTALIADIQKKFKWSAQQAGGSAELEQHWDFRPFIIAASAPIYQRIQQAIASVGLEPIPVISPGGSDANALNERGIPAMNLGSGAQNPHADEEFILLEDLARSQEIFEALVRP